MAGKRRPASAAISVDLERRTLTVGAKVFRPPRQEFELAAYLARRPGVVRSRAELLDVLGVSLNRTDRTIDTVVKRLRARLGVDPIGTRHGYGYYWREE